VGVSGVGGNLVVSAMIMWCGFFASGARRLHLEASCHSWLETIASIWRCYERGYVLRQK
jgi:hypothetical protein